MGFTNGNAIDTVGSGLELPRLAVDFLAEIAQFRTGAWLDFRDRADRGNVDDRGFKRRHGWRDREARSTTAESSAGVFNTRTGGST